MQSNNDVLSALPRDDRLTGRTAEVTGSISGIGEAIARVLAASGATVLVSGRDATRADAVTAVITAAGGTAHALVADLAARPEELRATAVLPVELAGGRLDVLVNNAGVYPASATEDLDGGITATRLG